MRERRVDPIYYICHSEEVSLFVTRNSLRVLDMNRSSGILSSLHDIIRTILPRRDGLYRIYLPVRVDDIRESSVF